MKAFRPGWKMTMFTVLFCPLLFTMGQWQLEREQEKIALQADYDQRLSAPPVAFDEIDWRSDELAFLGFSATGEFDNARSFLLDNRTNNSRVGYELVVPFNTAGGETVLINRGWLPQGRTRAILPEIDAVLGQVEIEASVYVPLGETFLLSAVQETPNSWPRVIQSLDIPQMSKAYGADLLPYTARLSEDSIAALAIDWPAVNMSPEKHRGYAVQWFAMLAALISLYVYFGFKHPDLNNTEEKK